MSAIPVGASSLVQIELDARVAKPGESLVGKGVPADRRHHSNVRPEAGTRDRLVRTLAAGKPFERRSADRLTGAGQRRAAHDEIEVDRADDGDPGSAHGDQRNRGPAQSAPPRGSLHALPSAALKVNAAHRPCFLEPWASGRQGAQVVDGRAEERVAEIEEAGPERRAVGCALEARCIGKALERTNEHGQLEVRGRDAVRARMNPGPIENGPPLDELPCPRPAVPRASLCPFGLELQEIPRERGLEACKRGLDAVRGMAEGGLTRAGRRRIRLPPVPPFE